MTITRRPGTCRTLAECSGIQLCDAIDHYVGAPGADDLKQVAVGYRAQSLVPRIVVRADMPTVIEAAAAEEPCHLLTKNAPVGAT